MNFKMRHFLSGIAIYASGVLAAQALFAFNVDNELTISIVSVGVLGLFSLIAGMDLQARAIREVIPYSLSWTLIAVVLDVFLAVPVLGWGFLLTPDVVIGYAIIALIPLLPLLFRSRAAASAMQSP